MADYCGSPWELCDNPASVRYSVTRANGWGCVIELCDRCAEYDGEDLERAGYTATAI